MKKLITLEQPNDEVEADGLDPSLVAIDRDDLVELPELSESEQED
ncbi:hypothetical protein ACFLWR_00480 [Chloroflexota bacterium]